MCIKCKETAEKWKLTIESTEDYESIPYADELFNKLILQHLIDTGSILQSWEELFDIFLAVKKYFMNEETPNTKFISELIETPEDMKQLARTLFSHIARDSKEIDAIFRKLTPEIGDPLKLHQTDLSCFMSTMVYLLDGRKRAADTLLKSYLFKIDQAINVNPEHYAKFFNENHYLDLDTYKKFTIDQRRINEKT